MKLPKSPDPFAVTGWLRLSAIVTAYLMSWLLVLGIARLIAVLF